MIYKEDTGRLILEASTGQHGDLARQLADAWAEMATENERLQAVINEVHSWIVCAAIASPEDLMQNAERIVSITEPDTPT